jgi:hypothetical protein
MLRRVGTALLTMIRLVRSNMMSTLLLSVSRMDGLLIKGMVEDSVRKHFILDIVNFQFRSCSFLCCYNVIQRLLSEGTFSLS